MEETERPFPCTAEGCSMRFPDENQLAVHMKKHDMVLNLGTGHKNMFMADQTPTPTRFIRNCEEVGLFQDLQNVNPFEETFRKAVETGKTGFGPLHQGGNLSVPTCSDDTLHTPHVFPYIHEESNSPTPHNSNNSRGSSCSQDEFSRGSVLINIVTDSSHELITGDVNSSNKETQQEQDTDSSSGDKQDTVVKMLWQDEEGEGVGDDDTKGGRKDLLIFRMPDGKLVQLAGRPVEMSDTTPGSVLQVAPAGSTIPQQDSEAVHTSGISAIVSNSQSDNSQLSLVKREVALRISHSSLMSSDRMKPRLGDWAMATATLLSNGSNKLKQTLTNVARVSSSARKPSVTTCESSADYKPVVIHTPRKLSIPRVPPVYVPSSPTTPPGSHSEHSSGAEDPQEKRMKFLERNRAAAMRCREKRKTWVQELEMRARNMQATNHNLVAEVAALKSEVASLKTLLLAHRNCPVTQALAQESTHQIINLAVPAPTIEENTSQKKGTSTGNPIVIFNTTSTVPPRKRKHITNGIPTVPSSSLSLPKQLIPSSILQLAPVSSIQLAPSSTIQLTESSNLPPTLHLATNSSPSSTIQLVRTSGSSSTIQIETIPSIVTHPSVGQANVACERNTPSVLVTKPAIQSTISLAFQPTNNATPAIIIPKLCFTSSSGQKAVNGHLLGSSVTSQVIKVNPNILNKELDANKNKLSMSCTNRNLL
uniref:Cyclic AMP-dependent transcription factor ATF-2 n=1 Tax=Timema shepardi TaxID=629360 RepID=A0A7R9B669_TIMSH|nr:unnamed protein product [Timema shepardi]